MDLKRTLAPFGLATVLVLSPAAWAQSSTAKTDKAAPATPASGERGRDWSQIDTNRDGLVSPEEMEAWLKANPGPLKGR